jgi:FG-GAP repeat
MGRLAPRMTPVAVLALCTALLPADVINEDLKLVANDGALHDYFGWSVAIDDGVIVVRAPQDGNQNGGFAGSAYVFNVSSAPCLGDLDGDGDTNQSDLGILLADYECGT